MLMILGLLKTLLGFCFRMTSCVFSLLLFISLFSSIGAQGPVGVKVRVTNQALDMLKNQALAILQEQLVNQPFNDLKCGGGVMKCAIKRLTISKLTVDQADLQFQERTGFMLEIRKFSLFLSYERQLAPCLGDTGSSIFAVGGLSVSIGMSLQRNKQGHLRVEMPNCQVNAENMALISTGKLKDLWNSLQGCLRGLFNTLFCPLVKMIGLAAANKKLDAMMENREILKQYAINIDYSVTRDVQVTSTNLDVCFKGMVYRKGENRLHTSI
ncbi:phospholipid transfer protein-like isoform X1 [Lates japonicus]